MSVHQSNEPRETAHVSSPFSFALADVVWAFGHGLSSEAKFRTPDLGGKLGGAIWGISKLTYESAIDSGVGAFGVIE